MKTEFHVAGELQLNLSIMLQHRSVQIIFIPIQQTIIAAQMFTGGKWSRLTNNTTAE